MAKSKKRVKIDENIKISVKRQPKSRENPDSYFDYYPSWSFSKCDFEHEKWSLKKSDFLNEILDKLISFERRKWSDIVNDDKHNHWIDCKDFSKEAKKRLEELNLHYDQLFSLRLTGTLRLFGYIQDGVYYVIWYDPNHEICPSYKKHT
ncbi:MAG: hypothetical protein IJ666_03925 [Ruminococcus sp.]|nr:hypothetical protein [Ruminococcus sp.]